MDFLAVLSEQTDEAGTLRAALERVLQSLGAEVGVVFSGESSPIVVGLDGEYDLDHDSIVHLARQDHDHMEITGVGPCHSTAVTLDREAERLRLFVARSGQGPFGPDELLLLRGTAWVLHLALRPLRVLVCLNERQRMLDQVALVQRAIANRAPLPETLDIVTASVLDLFGAELAMLYLADQGILLLASVSVVDEKYRPPDWPMQLRSSIGRAAYTRNTLVRTDNYARSEFANPYLVDLGAQAAMAAPVRENGAVVGSLVAMSFRPDHTFTLVQEQTMLTFADQISTALSDARTLATAQHAIRDPVTGLPNRVFFTDLLEQTLARGVHVHVLFLDLDRFKYVNDTLGHGAGDELLRQVGLRLRQCLRAGDCLARFGGDEFAVMVVDEDRESVFRLGQRLLTAAQSPYLLDSDQVNVGASIGIAECHSGAAPGDVLREADTAMYRAKHSGGNRLVVFETSMHTALVQRANLENDLRRALAGQQLCLRFQPVFELTTGEVRAAEALVRWQHPTRGTINPAEFIPLAEETGLIIPIGRQILRMACQYAADWVVDPGQGPGRGGRSDPGADGRLSVSVNLSAQQLFDEHLVADVRAALSSAGLAPSRLILEITEGTFVTDGVEVLDRLRQLRDIGVRLAIDDFGTGYSSLSYLRTFPVDILKIDRSFVEGVAAGWQGTAFLNTIVRLSETLSMAAVGEGVETAEQLSALRALGCPYGQGFLFAKPMPPEEFTHFLSQRPHRDPVVAAAPPN